MRIIRSRYYLPTDTKTLWDLLINVKDYSQFVPFVKSVEIGGELKEGSRWSDITTILFFPMKITHIVKDFKKGKLLYYEIPLPFKGSISERIELEEKDPGCFVSVSVSFDLGNLILNIFIGQILSWRIHQMIEGTFADAKNRLNGNSNMHAVSL